MIAKKSVAEGMNGGNFKINEKYETLNVSNEL